MGFFQHNKIDLMNVGSNDNGTKMLDKLTRIGDERRIEPLDKFDNISYKHRRLYNGYCLELGDCTFMIPPEFIMVTSESTTGQIVTLRQENTMKEKHGHHRRTILIDLVFNGLNQLNGFKVEGPDKDYYVDGLRPLLAQFKCTPFLPISNVLINQTYGIFSVVLQGITISTIEGFPNAMKAQLTLQEANMFPYLEVPDYCFRNMIDWDLFKFYYQSFLTEKHVYKRLQSLPADKSLTHFKMSILDAAIFADNKVTEYNIMDVVTEKKILNSETGTNYITWLDSDTMDARITSFQCGYQNLLTSVQFAQLSSPTMQFLGGMDTIYNITFETTDPSVIQALEQCQIENDALIRTNYKLHGAIGFVRLESELVEFTGSLFVMIDSVTTNTVPEFPGLYSVQINCVSYDIAQSEREELEGFRPFDDYLGTGTGVDQNDTYKGEVIDQSTDGLMTKIRQDNYAEWKLATMEVYPDLKLPTYQEVNEQIKKIISFRKRNGLTDLPYSVYPTRPASMLHGINPNSTPSVSFNDDEIVDVGSINRKDYELYVDPDFYVFYPASYHSFMSEDGDYYTHEPTNMSGYKKDIVNAKFPIDGEEGTELSGSIIDRFISSLNSMLGHSYKYGSAGTEKDSKGLCFDAIGLITWGLNSVGVTNNLSLSYNTVQTNTELFRKIEDDELNRGDILCSNNHAGVYLGDSMMIHCVSGKKKGVIKESYSSLKRAGKYRVRAFESNKDDSENAMDPMGSGNVDMSDTAQSIHSILKDMGYTDVAIAGILGNMVTESGVRSDNVQDGMGKDDTSYTNGVDNGSISRDSFINDGAGYGLVQFTYHTYKQELYDKAKASGRSISDVQLQCEVLDNQISGLKNSLNACSTPEEAASLFMHKYERPKSYATENKRKSDARGYYSGFGGSSDSMDPMGSGSSSSNSSGSYETSEDGSKTLTEGEFNKICRVVNSCTWGDNPAGVQGAAQMIYDRMNDPNGTWGGTVEGAVNGLPFSSASTPQTEGIVRRVFCEDYKRWPNSACYYYLSPHHVASDFEPYDNNYDRLKSAGQNTYWGYNKGATSHERYVIIPGDYDGNSEEEENKQDTSGGFEHETYNVNTQEIDNGRFGEPLIINTSYYKNYTKGTTNKFVDVVNGTENSFNTAFCDMYQYSCRGRLVRAFPAYLFCILDDDSAWYRGDKLWSNYYTHKSTVDIQFHGTNDMPVDTATLVVNDIARNLSRTNSGMSSYDILNDPEVFRTGIGRKLYKEFGIKLGFGPKLTSMLIQLHQVIYAHAKLKDGARAHLRVGYGSDPMSLAPMINGFISDVQLGDQITMVISSDGNELIAHEVSSKENDTNSGWLGLFGLGEDQEGSEIVANILCERESFINRIYKGWGEANKYSIEHFGLNLSTSIVGQENANELAPIGTVGGAIAGGALAAATGPVGLIGALVMAGGVISGLGLGTVASTIGIKIVDTAGGSSDLDSTGKSTSISISDLWDAYAEQFDLLKNIYRTNYRGELYIQKDTVLGPGDGEKNVVFNKYNMTPWDVFQVCTQSAPEYVVKAGMHQFDSRVYFGLPFWQEKFRYDLVNGDKVVEECKTAAQVHFIDSMDSIIDDQIMVTSKFTDTNMKVMYTRGKSSVSTMTMYSDMTIDHSKQKTKILDTPISQNILGPDQIFEWLGYKVGHESARRVGISNLIYGWNAMYQGELICTGSPGIKAGDYIIVNDTFTNIFGLCIVREVIHSFSVNTGYITTIIPGLIALSSDQNSGMCEMVKSFLATGSSFASYTNMRNTLYRNYEKSIKFWGDMAVLRDMDGYWRQSEGWGMFKTGSKIATTTYRLAKTANLGVFIFRACKDLGGGMAVVTSIATKAKEAYTALKAAGGIANMAKEMFTVGRGISGVLSALKDGTFAVSLAGAPETGGLSVVVGMVAWIAMSVLLDKVIEYLDNRNVIVIVPLYREGYPMANRIKDGEHILLLQDHNGTDEKLEDFEEAKED